MFSFLAARLLQGACGAMMVPVGRIIMLRYAPRDRLMIVISNMVWPALVAPVLGPSLGGFITTPASWHWIFFLNLALGIVTFVAAMILLPKFDAQVLRRFD